MFNFSSRRTNKKTQKRGFSLVELIVVILIIAILAVAVFAGGSSAIKKAQKARVTSDLHNFQIAVDSTIYAHPEVMNITNGTQLSAIMDALNANLPTDYKVTLQTVAFDGNINMGDPHYPTAEYIICKSEKTDAWDNAYYVILDSAERGGSMSSEFYTTCISAGPNAILNLTAEIDRDDIFVLSSYVDSDVRSFTYDVSKEVPTISDGSTAATSYTDPATAPVNNGITTKATPISSGGGGGSSTPISIPDGYVTFTSTSNFSLSAPNYWDGTLEWNDGASDWVVWDGSEIATTTGTINLRGTNNTSLSCDSPWELTGSNISCAGNFENLLDYATVAASGHPDLNSNCFDNMLAENTALVSVAGIILPVNITDNCCYRMFKNCDNITDSPSLPATTVECNCYYEMFSGCSSMTSAPALPATTMANYCYYSMFSGCSSLTTAPTLPATTLAEGCYSSMFFGCTSLTNAPSLPATTMETYCYQSMFHDCSSLTSAPVLSSTNLADNCYDSMFAGCTSLTSAPALPATTMAGFCYTYMFQGCTSLVFAPALPSTTLFSGCYSSMFAGCTALVSAPALPATTLDMNVYRDMFNGCTALTSVPALPATSMCSYCYMNMFKNCSSLKFSTTQTSECPYEFRVPTDGDGVYAYAWCTGMISGTGGTFTGTSGIEFGTIYYTNNPPVS